MAIKYYNNELTTNKTTSNYQPLNLSLKIDGRQITPELNTAQMTTLAKYVNDGELGNFNKIELKKN